MKSTDDSGTANDNDTHEITVTITGTNDVPVVTAITGTATEDTTLTASGDIIADHVTDADKTDTHAIVKVDGDTSKVGTSVSGTYGSITVNADGTYTYTLNNGTNGDGGSSVQKLAEGEHYDEVFSVTVSDGHGGETMQNRAYLLHEIKYEKPHFQNVIDSKRRLYQTYWYKQQPRYLPPEHRQRHRHQSAGVSRPYSGYGEVRRRG